MRLHSVFEKLTCLAQLLCTWINSVLPWCFFVFDILFVLKIILHWTAFGFMFLRLGVHCTIGVWAVLKFVTWSDVLHLQRRFLMLHLFYFELTRTNFFGITVHRQKWILAKSNGDWEGNTCVFNRNYTDSCILSYLLSVGCYTLSLEIFACIWTLSVAFYFFCLLACKTHPPFKPHNQTPELCVVLFFSWVWLFLI